MSTWTSEELNKITSRDVELASPRREGSLRERATIWVVRHGDYLLQPIRVWAHLHLVSLDAQPPRAAHPRRLRQGRPLRLGRR